MSSPPSYTPRTDINTTLSTLRQTFTSNKTKDIRYRKWQLKQLYWLVADNIDAFLHALHQDLSRPEFESRFVLKNLLGDITYHIDHVSTWARDQTPNSGFLYTKIGRTTIRNEPRGVAFIIGAWNFPETLTLSPLASAMAAGCCALVKPSEIAAHTAELMIRLASRYLDASAYAFVSGGAAETQYMLTLKFDHVFFTGSTPVARHVAAATAMHLTPTVLELGGQGPAIVTKSANVDLAAQRIASAKFMNAGQICLSVNHMFVHEDVHAEFCERIAFWNEEFMKGDDGRGQMCSVINERNYGRLRKMLEGTKGRVICGGLDDKSSSSSSSPSSDLKLFPTVVSNVSISDSLLTEELFGPILPIITADTATAVKTIASMPHPLSIYIFSSDDKEIKFILDHTLSGGVTINDTMLHAATPETPFGGVGDSGSGAYHGRYGFDTFTHKRTVVQLPNWMDKVMGFRYPPYDMKKAGIAMKISKPSFKRGETLEDQRVDSSWSGMGMVGAAVAVVTLGVGVASYADVRSLRDW